MTEYAIIEGLTQEEFEDKLHKINETWRTKIVWMDMKFVDFAKKGTAASSEEGYIETRIHYFALVAKSHIPGLISSRGEENWDESK